MAKSLILREDSCPEVGLGRRRLGLSNILIFQACSKLLDKNLGTILLQISAHEVQLKSAPNIEIGTSVDSFLPTDNTAVLTRFRLLSTSMEFKRGNKNFTIAWGNISYLTLGWAKENFLKIYGISLVLFVSIKREFILKLYRYSY